jgi:hypothetical protein
MDTDTGRGQFIRRAGRQEKKKMKTDAGKDSEQEGTKKKEEG